MYGGAMRILVIGAGPLGSLIAARLFQGGQDVSLLARGTRIQELEEHGVVLRPWTSEDSEAIRVPVLTEFTAEDDFDLVMVVMRKNSALKVLPMLAKNIKVPTFLFLMNNASGPQEFENALGKERVVMGFPGAAGYREGHTVVHMNAEPEKNMEIVMGSGSFVDVEKIENLANELRKGRYMGVSIEPCMDAWSKYHVALLFPSLAPAFYLCANDRLRMSRTRDALVLAWRAIGEGFSALKKMGYPMSPKSLKKFQFIPEPLAVGFMKKIIKDPRMEVAMVRHAEVIRDEIQQLNGEFLQLLEGSGAFTPNINFLIDQYNKKAPLLPDGSRSISLRWSDIFIPILLVVALVLFLITIF
jgi:2-dehydropantoate 2-reductase